MRLRSAKSSSSALMVLGGAVLWGLLELLALQASRLRERLRLLGLAKSV